MALEKTIKIKVDQAGASSDVNKLDSSMNRLDGTTKDTNKSFGALRATVIAVAAALQARQIAQYADAFTSIQNQIRQTTKTTSELTNRTSELLGVANRSRVEFSATAELYTQLALSTENLNLSTQEQLRLTETIAKSFAVSGKSAAESAGAIRQLGQAFASGALRGDEFNSIAEGAPEIMRALQRSLNLTQGELREFAATGGITAEILVKALGGAADVIDGKMSKSVRTLAQSFQEAENNAIKFVGSNSLIQDSMETVGSSIVSLSENLDQVANVLLTVATVGFAKLSSAAILSTVETIKKTVADRASAVAALESARAQQVAALAMFNSATGATKGSIAVNQLSAANINLARTSKIAASSIGIMGRSMALLGGPVGIAILAASAITFFITSAEDAEEKTARLAGEVDTLAQSFQGLTASQIQVELRNATNDANALEKAVLEADIKLKRLGEDFKQFGTGGNAVLKAASDVEELTSQLEKAVQKRDELFQAGLSAERTPESGEEAKLTPTKGKDKSKVTDIFVNTEKSKTDTLRAELEERRTIQIAFNNLMLQDFSSLAEQERAIAEFNRQQELAGLARDMEASQIDFKARREQILTNTRLTAEQKAELEIELQLQELDQKRLFELDKNQIERDAAEERKLITQDEIDFKTQANIQASEIITSVNQNMTQDVLGFLSQFGQKSKVLAKALLLLRSGEGVSSAIINSQVAATRALAELGPIAGPPAASTMITYGKVSAGIIAANAALKIGGGSSSSSGASIGGAGGFSGSVSQRQDPINQNTVVDFRGLDGIADALNNLDPDEVLPVEYTQRIVASLGEFNRLSGG